MSLFLRYSIESADYTLLLSLSTLQLYYECPNTHTHIQTSESCDDVMMSHDIIHTNSKMIRNSNNDKNNNTNIVMYAFWAHFSLTDT